MAIALAVTGAIAGGWGSTWLLVHRPPAPLRRPPHTRTNYRGREVAGTLGVVLSAAVGTGGLVAVLLALAGRGALREGASIAGAGIALGALGFIDDVYGDRSAGGFRGHLRALREGSVTTGAVKAAGGGVVGLLAAWAIGLDGWWIVAGGAVIALGANLANLLDVRPGRTLKGWVAAWIVLLAGGTTAAALVVSSGLAGGVAAFLPSDLGERGMLGDTGANLAGGTLAAAAAASVEGAALLVLLSVLVVLTAASELISFNRVIASTPPLRAVDGWGRARE